MNKILDELTATIKERLNNTGENDSYVARLKEAGFDKILEKVGEEAIETILAAKHAELHKDNEKLVYETADLLFHVMVMLASAGSSLDEVLTELQRRFGTSGLEEKRNRIKQ